MIFHLSEMRPAKQGCKKIKILFYKFYKTSNFPLFLNSKETYCHMICVTVDGVWAGERIYLPLIHTARNYK
jgi:hypothetical protein